MRKSQKTFRQWFDQNINILAIRKRLQDQDEHIRALNTLLQSERHRSTQFGLLTSVTGQLKSVLDQPVSAQLVATAIQRAFECSLVAILTYDHRHWEFVSMAVAGNPESFPSPSYRQKFDAGMIGRAARTRKTQFSNDTRLDPDYVAEENKSALSEIVIPLISNGDLKGVLVADDKKAEAFNKADIATLEAVAEQLLNAWDRANYQNHLTELLQTSFALSTLLEPQSVIEQVASLAPKTLQAQFAFVTLLDRERAYTRTAYTGDFPKLVKALRQDPAKDPLIQGTLHSPKAIRLRDTRRSDLTSHLGIEDGTLRTMIAVPVRLRQNSIGVILVFGKQGEDFFTESDESLIELLASQAAAAIESTWLYQKLETIHKTASVLYQLSIQIIQSESLHDAAVAIAETAYKLGNASITGIILYSKDNQELTRVEYDQSGVNPGQYHPMWLIEQAISSRNFISMSDDRYTSKFCFPLQSPHRDYGALWLDIPEGRSHDDRYKDNLQTLANQATLALERLILLQETRDQAERLKKALEELESSYDLTLSALMSALDARDRETEGHSWRVGQVACQLGKEMGLDPNQLKTLERGALLHDIGKIGVSDSILHKPGPLNPDEWESMKKHPDIGARIAREVPFLGDAVEVIQYHHERWNGSGYPAQLSGTNIPILARIFAIADAFDALTSQRPYRESLPAEVALDHLRSQAGILFDASIVDIFERLITSGVLDDVIHATEIPTKQSTKN